MKITIGIVVTLLGALGALAATPYAIIVAMMSGFSDDSAALLAYCAAVPILGIGILVVGIRTICGGVKSAKEENRK